MSGPSPPSIAIRRLRIVGLAGATPSKADIEAAVTRAFTDAPATAAAPRGPVTLPHGTSLDAAANAAARSVRGLKR